MVQNFLASLNAGQSASNQQQQHQQMDRPSTTLSDLLPTSTTIPFVETLSSDQIDNLCAFLPPELFLITHQESASATSTSTAQPTPAAAQAALSSLSHEQKKDVLRRVLRSPQLHQSLGSLTVALRDGGLPMIGEALGLKVANGGVIRGGSVPLGGGEAIDAFVDGVKRSAEEEGK